jgi:hypothetical protein
MLHTDKITNLGQRGSSKRINMPFQSTEPGTVRSTTPSTFDEITCRSNGALERRLINLLEDPSNGRVRPVVLQ